MKLPCLKLFRKNERGFTIVEVLVALAITGIISLGASVSGIQLVNQTSRDTDYTTASRNSMNAIHWISRDALVAQATSGYAGFPAADDLTFSWESWDNTEYSASYSVTDGALWRAYTSDGNTVSTLIAEHINTAEDMTFCTSDNGVLTLSVTSSVGGGDFIINVTKIRTITNRPKL